MEKPQVQGAAAVAPRFETAGERGKRRIALCLGKRDADDTAAVCAYALNHILQRDDEVTLVHVSDTPTPTWVTEGEKRAVTFSAEKLPPWVPERLASVLQKEWRVADFITAVELDAGPSVSAADAIVDFCASELKPDLIITGSKTRGVLARVVMSSVSSGVVEYAESPTLVVRGTSLTVPDAAAPLQLSDSEQGRRIALCLDGTSASRRAVAWATHTLLRPSDDIFLLHSPAGLAPAEVLPAMGEVQACRTQLLSRGFAEHRVVPVELDFHVDARDSIVDFLEAEGARKPFDLVLCGSRGLHGTLTRYMLGSLTRYLLLHAPCPLLVLPNAMLREAAEATEAGPA